MKKKKLEAKLTRTKEKLAKTRTELDAMFTLLDQSGVPKADEERFAGTPAESASKTPKKSAPKPSASATSRSAPKKTAAKIKK